MSNGGENHRPSAVAFDNGSGIRFVGNEYCTTWMLLSSGGIRRSISSQECSLASYRGRRAPVSFGGHALASYQEFHRQSSPKAVVIQFLPERRRVSFPFDMVQFRIPMIAASTKKIV
ncbi:MAG: hypothetical protein ACKVT0_12240 [Planctomycetaceae bacterium]